MQYSRFIDWHRSVLLISNLHARRSIAAPVSPFLGVHVMVGRGIAIAAHAVAAVANHHFYRELAHLGVALTAHTTRLAAGEPTIDPDDRSPSPFGLVGTKRYQPAHSGIGNRQGKMPVPHHALDVEGFEFEHTGLGCQPVRNLVQQILSLLANLAVNAGNPPRLDTAAGLSLFRRDSARCARRSRFCALRKRLGAAISSNPVPS